MSSSLTITWQVWTRIWHGSLFGWPMMIVHTFQNTACEYISNTQHNFKIIFPVEKLILSCAKSLGKKKKKVFTPLVYFECHPLTCHNFLYGSQSVQGWLKGSHEGITDLDFKKRRVQEDEEEDMCTVNIHFQNFIREKEKFFVCMCRNMWACSGMHRHIMRGDR